MLTSAPCFAQAWLNAVHPRDPLKQKSNISDQTSPFRLSQRTDSFYGLIIQNIKRPYPARSRSVGSRGESGTVLSNRPIGVRFISQGYAQNVVMKTLKRHA
jgi:hypothetical protein